MRVISKARPAGVLGIAGLCGGRRATSGMAHARQQRYRLVAILGRGEGFICEREYRRRVCCVQYWRQ